MSELDTLIPPEIHGDAFYALIEEISSREDITTVLELGSSSGEGSTQAFVHGLQHNPGKPIFYCMEVSTVRYAALRDRYADYDFVKCYHAASVSVDAFMDEDDVKTFYKTHKTNVNKYPLDEVLRWLEQDRTYITQQHSVQNGIQLIKKENRIDYFDMVLIDSSAFTGRAELEEVYGTQWILLDDINDIKNYDNYYRLVNDTLYTLYCDNWTTRNGFAVFKKMSL